MVGENSIAKAFRDQTVFLTGATGFVGKMVLEKLLRDSPDVRCIYLLIRHKKGKTSEERLVEIFDAECFELLKHSGFRDWGKVRLVSGDCAAPRLGLAAGDAALLQREVTILIHVAANVRFDVSLRNIYNSNVRPVDDLLEMAHQMPKLQAFAYVSTAYSHCHLGRVEEKFYEPPIAPEQLVHLLDTVDDTVLETLTPKIIGPMPNTYVFSKAIAEELIRTKIENIPFTIIRPGIVTSAIEQPLVGWIDNFWGPVGLILAASFGIIRAINTKRDAIINFVPVDMVSNAILAAIWDTLNGNSGQVYNVCVSEKNYISPDDLSRIMWDECSWEYPTNKMVWYQSCPIIESTFWFNVYSFFTQTIPTYSADFVLVCMGRKKLAVRNLNKAKQIIAATSYFVLNKFQFKIDNLNKLYSKLSKSDKTKYNFNMDTIDWINYVKTSVVGGRVYLLKDPVETIPEAKRKLRYYFIAHYALLTLIFCLFYCLLMFIFKRIF